MSSDEAAQKALGEAQRANLRLDGHEDLCADRYQGILKRMGRQEVLLWGLVLLLLMGDGTVLDVIKRLAGVK